MKLLTHYKKKHWLVLSAGVLLLLVLFFVFSTPSALGQENTGAQEEQFAADGAANCLRCHNKAPENVILNTVHANRADPRTPFSAHDCESCHGASSEHYTQLASPAIVFGIESNRYPVSEIDVQNQVCLGCHESGQRMHCGLAPVSRTTSLRHNNVSGGGKWQDEKDIARSLNNKH